MQELSLNILDLAQNSISADATRIEIAIEEDTAADTLTVTLRDNGCGMSQSQLEAVTDPFYTTRTTRKVGLGVPFFKMAAEMSGGRFEISSTTGEGTCVRGVFGLSHIDRMPLGDVNGTVETLIYCNPQLDFVYTRSRDGKSFTLDTCAVRAVLGDVPLNANDVTLWLKAYLAEGEQEVVGEE
jgi:hypothetical protein